MKYRHIESNSPGVSPRWVDKQKGFPKKHACYPVEIIQAINRARDNGIPSHRVLMAIESLHQQTA